MRISRLQIMLAVDDVAVAAVASLAIRKSIIYKKISV